MSEILGDKLNIVYEDTLLEITPELMKKTIVKQDKEIERLNNIINELEIYLSKIKETSTPQERLMAKYVLEYIEELKGSDK